MAGGPGPRARQRLAELETLHARVQTIHGLVERYAAERGDVEPHLTALRRAFNRLKVDMAGLGLDSMSQLCASMELAVRRGGSRPFKVRILRDGVGSLRMQLDIEMRVTLAEPAADARADRVDREED